MTALATSEQEVLVVAEGVIEDGSKCPVRLAIHQPHEDAEAERGRLSGHLTLGGAHGAPTEVYAGRVYGLGQRRALTFALPLPESGSGYAGHYDVMRLSWHRDATLRGTWIPQRHAARLRVLSIQAMNARSVRVKQVATSELAEFSERHARPVTLDVIEGFNHIIPSDMRGLRRQLLDSPGPAV